MKTIEIFLKLFFDLFCGLLEFRMFVGKKKVVGVVMVGFMKQNEKSRNKEIMIVKRCFGGCLI
ncbi:MAG: hypothetical protein PHD45_10540 [Bacteroidales bacterium]|nr:hypothetical protein [Bacteroidales bacterium]